jgi:hypothetical protein
MDVTYGPETFIPMQGGLPQYAVNAPDRQAVTAMDVTYGPEPFISMRGAPPQYAANAPRRQAVTAMDVAQRAGCWGAC